MSVAAGVVMFALIGFSLYTARYAWTVEERGNQATGAERRRARLALWSTFAIWIGIVLWLAEW